MSEERNCKERLNPKIIKIAEKLDWTVKEYEDGTAEFASRYLTKGRKIIVEGHIHTRNYEDRDGNNRKATEIYAEHIEFADSKPQEQGPSVQYGGYR